MASRLAKKLGRSIVETKTTEGIDELYQKISHHRNVVAQPISALEETLAKLRTDKRYNRDHEIAPRGIIMETKRLLHECKVFLHKLEEFEGQFEMDMDHEQNQGRAEARFVEQTLIDLEYLRGRFDLEKSRLDGRIAHAREHDRWFEQAQGDTVPTATNV
ncbi:hypothetical protein ACEQ8H_002203 [Pleosporales sp. CAS-2024a]